jgi:hypothetical protein
MFFGGFPFGGGGGGADFGKLFKIIRMSFLIKFNYRGYA